MRKHILPFLLICFFVISCNEKDEQLVAENTSGIFGHWVQVGYEDNIQILTRTPELQNDAYAFSILPNKKFIENKNNSFCGTPPVIYSTYEGNWISISDNLLKIEAPYWGGTMHFNMEIVSVSDDTLKVVIHPLQ